MPGMRKEIPKWGTSNCYGDTERRGKIKALWGHNTSVVAMETDVPKDAVCINGRFVYTLKHKALKAGRVKTASCIENESLLDARFCEKGFQEAIGANASAPPAQLQCMGVF